MSPKDIIFYRSGVALDEQFDLDVLDRICAQIRQAGGAIEIPGELGPIRVTHHRGPLMREAEPADAPVRLSVIVRGQTVRQIGVFRSACRQLGVDPGIGLPPIPWPVAGSVYTFSPGGGE